MMFTMLHFPFLQHERYTYCTPTESMLLWKMVHATLGVPQTLDGVAATLDDLIYG